MAGCITWSAKVLTNLAFVAITLATVALILSHFEIMLCAVVWKVEETADNPEPVTMVATDGSPLAIVDI